jgi:hypothetical protein
LDGWWQPDRHDEGDQGDELNGIDRTERCGWQARKRSPWVPGIAIVVALGATPEHSSIVIRPCSLPIMYPVGTSSFSNNAAAQKSTAK